ncbi:MAG TPA: HNH endonuclease signature motif containing protein [Chloroflexota bacterium]|nr:HNH endonuclease signature motif containing protein [Chloroflexota bacterium]
MARGGARRLTWAIVGALLVLPFVLAACRGSASTASPVAAQIGQRTKTSGCEVNGKLADSACTPGAIIATATKAQICQPGYAKNVRDVPTSEKDQVYAEYSIKSHKAGQYEVDHLISLELGGSNDIANLWPEAADPKPGFHEKDKVENYLHDQVCSGAVSLSQVQVEIATNWFDVYQKANLK